MKKKKVYIGWKYIYRDLCACIITVICTIMFFHSWYAFVEEHNQTGHLLGYGNLLMAIIAYVALLIVTMRVNGGFAIGVDRQSKIIASQVIALFLTNFIEIFVSCAITGQFRFFWMFLRIYFIIFIIQCVLIPLLSVIMVRVYRRLFPPMRVIAIYGDHLKRFSSKMDQRPDKYHVEKYISYHDGNDVLKQEIPKYDAVLVNDLPDEQQNDIIKYCFEINKRIYFVPKISDIIVKSSDELNLFDTPFYLCRNRRMRLHQRIVKRFLDVFLSGLALVVLSPVFLIVAICIKREDGGPVFYKQERCTINGRRFWILKFRSMIVNAENDGKSHPAGEKDDRITKVGKVIRAIRVDELPQLINILKGDMSIIGPRPERVEHVEKYSKIVPEFNMRHKVKGGLSGYAQVYGKYNTTPLDKIKLDLMYITNYSLALDVQIIFETLKILFQKESTEGFTEEAQKEIMGEPDQSGTNDNVDTSKNKDK